MDKYLEKQIIDKFNDTKKYMNNKGYLINFTDYNTNTSSYFTLRKFKDYAHFFKKLIDIFDGSYVAVDAILDLAAKSYKEAQQDVTAINCFIENSYEYARSHQMTSEIL